VFVESRAIFEYRADLSDPATMQGNRGLSRALCASPQQPIAGLNALVGAIARKVEAIRGALGWERLRAPRDRLRQLDRKNLLSSSPRTDVKAI